MLGIPSDWMEFATRVQLASDAEATLPAEVVVDIVADQLVGSERASGEAQVVYQFEKFEGKTEVDYYDVQVKLLKSSDLEIDTLREAVRAQIQALSNDEYEYDLRGLCFELGRMASKVVSGIEMAEQPCSVRFLQSEVTAVRRTDLVTCVPANVGREVLYTLACAARRCGMSKIYAATSQGLVGDHPRDDRAWRRYLHNTIQYVLGDACRMGVYGEHAVSLARGFTAHITLRAHSDEGGYVRKALRRARYPRPRGYLNTRLGTAPLPHFKSVHTNARLFMADVLSMVLFLAACFQDSDPLAGSGLSTALFNEDIEEMAEGEESSWARETGRPSSFAGLRGVLDRFEDHACVMFNRSDVHLPNDHHNDALPRGTFEAYFKDDLPDSHLKMRVLLPYLYVENSCVLRHPTSVKQPGPRAGRPSSLSLLPGDLATPTGSDQRYDGRGVQMAKYTYCAMSGTGLRGLGCYYLASSRWGGSGLKGGAVTVHSELGVTSEGLSMARGAEKPDLDNSAWVRHQCAIPAPGECYSGDVGVLLRFQRDRLGKIRTSPEALRAPVELYVGDLVFHHKDKLGSEDFRTRRNMTKELRVKLTQDELEGEQEELNAMYGKIFNQVRDPRTLMPAPSSAVRGDGEAVELDPELRGVDHEARPALQSDARPGALAASGNGQGTEATGSEEAGDPGGPGT